MSKSLEILDEISDRVIKANKQAEHVSQAEKWIAGAYWNLRKAIEQDLAEKSQEIRKEAEEGLRMANDVGDLIDEIIEPIDSFGNLLTCITNEDPGRAERIGLSIMAMADGMRYRCDEFYKKMEKLRPKTEKPDPDEIPDFRTVQPDTNEEDQLQRVFEVMRTGGKNWELLHAAITYSFEHSVRESAGKEVRHETH